MKKINLIALMICCLAAVTFTACNDDPGYKGLTPQEKTQAFNVVKGTYTGDLIYPSENPTNKSDVTDTVTVRWEIQSDSVMTIRNFPMALLANNITNKELAAALKAELPRDMKCYIDFTQVSPVTFFINPSLQSFTLNYSGKNHLVQVAMLGNNIYSFGAYDSSKKLLQMQIVEAAIYVNGILQKNALASAVPFVFKATKN
ncbi:MAG TPA: DUF4840 domain-containing protein [Prevotella sp.]|nr:DUF4840 domain-containing protein [Prevotella sp.]